jgi:hypothetical protein
MRQPTLSDIEYGMRKRATKREEFLRIMNDIIPWEEWAGRCISLPTILESINKRMILLYAFSKP